MAVVNAGLRGQYSWAHRAVDSRRSRGELDDAAYADAFLAAYAAALPYSEEHQLFVDGVRSEWTESPFEAARLANPMLNFDVFVTLAKESLGASPGDTVLIQPRMAQSQFGNRMWFFRLTSVTVDSIEVPVQSEVFEGEPSRIILPHSPAARVTVPQTDGSTPDLCVVVEGYLVCTRAGLAAVADPRVDSAAPPEEWGIDAIAIPVRHEAHFPRGTTAGSAAGDAAP
ncbi:MAG: hypothetical protein JNM94_13055 [Phycisphaerae bacterium]|nr:hypothetical protein [Phycisphaerae bacterium]